MTLFQGVSNGGSEQTRLSGLVVLIDKTTYVDTYNGKPVSCIIMITEPQTKDVWHLPRIQLTEQIAQTGPQPMAEYVRDEMSGRIGFAIDELIFEEEVGESDRTFLIFSGAVAFTVATDSIYSSVAAKSLIELSFLKENARVSPLHYKLARPYIKEGV